MMKMYFDMRKKFLIIPIVFFVIILTACSLSSNLQMKSESFEQLGFEINYPAIWSEHLNKQIRTTIDEDVGVLFEFLPDGKAENVKKLLYVGFIDNSSQDIEYKTFIQDLARTFEVNEVLQSEGITEFFAYYNVFADIEGLTDDELKQYEKILDGIDELIEGITLI